MKVRIKDIHCIEVGPYQTQVALILDNFNTHQVVDDIRIETKNEALEEILSMKGKIVDVNTD